MAFLPEEELEEDLTYEETQRSTEACRLHNDSSLGVAHTAEEAGVLQQYLQNLLARINQDLVQRENEELAAILHAREQLDAVGGSLGSALAACPQSQVLVREPDAATILLVKEQLARAAADGSLDSVLAGYPQSGLIQEAEVLVREPDAATILLVKEQLARAAADGSLDSVLAGYPQSGLIQEAETEWRIQITGSATQVAAAEKSKVRNLSVVAGGHALESMGDKLADEAEGKTCTSEQQGWTQALEVTEEPDTQRSVVEEEAEKQKAERLIGEQPVTEEVVAETLEQEDIQLKDNACLAAEADAAERTAVEAQELRPEKKAQKHQATWLAPDAPEEAETLVPETEVVGGRLQMEMETLATREAASIEQEAHHCLAAEQVEANRLAEAAMAAEAVAVNRQAEEAAEAAKAVEVNRRAEAATAARAEVQRLVAVADANRKDATQRGEADHLLAERAAAEAAWIPAEAETAREQTEQLDISCSKEATEAAQTKGELVAVTEANESAKLQTKTERVAPEVAVDGATATWAHRLAATEEPDRKKPEIPAAGQAEPIGTTLAATCAQTQLENLTVDRRSLKHAAEQQAESKCLEDDAVAASNTMESKTFFQSQPSASASESRRLIDDRLVPREPETKPPLRRRVPPRKEEQDTSKTMVKERIVELRRRFQALRTDHNLIHYKVGQLSTDMAHVRVQTEAALKILDRQKAKRG
eukprot:TRINITY_DN4570_c0_g1_i5.p1 TRINITY_DN4570_c0_g1~~TRINITY_DN4570_c0_g1_i5.p1  ORF type:complete len:826 (-),score=236.61 TRINITY_DN4570_c0_g1_i5:132-2252(-)